MQMFKIGNWVEWSDGLHKIYHIKENGLWLVDGLRSVGGIHMSSVKPLTLRNGDHVSTEGMTQEQFKRIRSVNPDSSGSVRTHSYLVFCDGDRWLTSSKKNLGYRERPRELTIEQILSTLPEEEEQKITRNELAELFGDNVPMKVIQMIWDADKNTSIDDLRKSIRNMIEQPEEQKLEGWLSIDVNSHVSYAYKKPTAQQLADFYIESCIPISLTYTHGQGLDDE